MAFRMVLIRSYRYFPEKVNKLKKNLKIKILKNMVTVSFPDWKKAKTFSYWTNMTSNRYLSHLILCTSASVS
jgi:hypothetical protein